MLNAARSSPWECSTPPATGSYRRRQHLQQLATGTPRGASASAKSRLPLQQKEAKRMSSSLLEKLAFIWPALTLELSVGLRLRASKLSA